MEKSWARLSLLKVGRARQCWATWQTCLLTTHQPFLRHLHPLKFRSRALGPFDNFQWICLRSKWCKFQVLLFCLLRRYLWNNLRSYKFRCLSPTSYLSSNLHRILSHLRTRRFPCPICDHTTIIQCKKLCLSTCMSLLRLDGLQPSHLHRRCHFHIPFGLCREPCYLWTTQCILPYFSPWLAYPIHASHNCPLSTHLGKAFHRPVSSIFFHRLVLGTRKDIAAWFSETVAIHYWSPTVYNLSPSVR